MKKLLIHFEKNNIINKKIVVTAIWIFSLITLLLLLTITYQELISEQITHNSSVVKILAGLTIGILLISGLLSGSKTARWMILLIVYIALLSPFVIYVMLEVFVPVIHENFWTTVIFPNIIMSVFIITLLSNKISLKLYFLKKDKKSRIKEQLYLVIVAIGLIGLYTYYIYIPMLYKSSLFTTV